MILKKSPEDVFIRPITIPFCKKLILSREPAPLRVHTCNASKTEDFIQIYAGLA
jgi:hypothetical protein